MNNDGVKRAEAYMVMSRVAQDLANEVEYADKIKKELDHRNQLFELSQENVAQLRKELDYIRESYRKLVEKYDELDKKHNALIGVQEDTTTLDAKPNTDWQYKIREDVCEYD